MAKLVFGMNQSLDGYVDHMAFAAKPPRSSATSSRRLRAGGQWWYGRPKCMRSALLDDDHSGMGCRGTRLSRRRGEPAEMGRLALLSRVGPTPGLLKMILEGRESRELKASATGG